MTPDYPGRTGQNGGGERAGPLDAAGLTLASLRLELLDLVAEQRGRDRRLAWLALQEGLGELLRLLVLDLPRQRRLVRVDVHVNDGRPPWASAWLIAARASPDRATLMPSAPLADAKAA